MSATDPPLFVFDLDDTLYRERDYARSALAFVGDIVEDRFGIPGARSALLGRFDAGERDVIGQIWQVHDLPEVERPTVIAAMQAHDPSICLDPGAAALIAALRQGGLPFAIVTDGRSVTQRAKIRALGLEDAVFISISEECGIEKTDPARLLPIAELFPGHGYILVGDNPLKDFVAANRLGWHTVMLCDTGLNIHSQRTGVGLDYAAACEVADLRILIGDTDGLA